MILLGDATAIDTFDGIDCLITDPPYSEHVHGNAVSHAKKKGATKRGFGFAHLDDDTRAWLLTAVLSMPRWSVIFSDVESSHLLRLPASYIRTIPWVRWSMPLLQGDRPAQGFEHIVLACGPGKKHWNGPGSITAFENEAEDGPPALNQKCLRGAEKHKAEKPLDLCLDLVSWFSDPGETVFDPFMGHATIGRACQLLKREYVGIEAIPETFANAEQRLASELSDSECERIARWLEKRYDVTTSTEKAKERLDRREADKDLFR